MFRRRQVRRGFSPAYLAASYASVAAMRASSSVLGNTFARDTRGYSLLVNDITSYKSNPGAALTPDKSAVVVIYRGSTGSNNIDATATRGKLYMKRWTVATKTWSAESTLVDVVGRDMRDASLTTLSDGRMALVYSNTGGATDRWGEVRFSSDQGLTFGAAQVLTSPWAWFVAATPMFEAPNGNLLIGIYGGGVLGTDPQTAWSAALLRSTNGGTTFGSQVTIANGNTVGHECSEPSFVTLGNGTLGCFLRDSGNEKIRLATSTDVGATWSALVDLWDGFNRPVPTKLASGGIIVGTRASDTTSTWPQAATYRVSYDAAGLVWGNESLLDDTDRSGLHRSYGNAFVDLTTAGLPGVIMAIYCHERLPNFVSQIFVDFLFEPPTLPVPSPRLDLAPVSAVWTTETEYLAGQLSTDGRMPMRAKADHRSGTTLNATNWDSLGSIANVVAKTTNYTAAHGDAVLADASGGAFTVTSPTARINAVVTVKKTDSSVNAVTFTPGSGTVDGAASVAIAIQNLAVTYICDGTNWFTLGATPVGLPWRFDIDPFMTPAAAVGTWTPTVDNTSLYCGRNLSDGAQNDSQSFTVVLGAGTWTLEMMHSTGTDRGIYTLQLDDGAGAFTTLGTIDGYSASTVKNVKTSITGIAVGAPIVRTLKVLMATKNGSSSSYIGAYQRVVLRRTA